jgi:hypothetical protein
MGKSSENSDIASVSAQLRECWGVGPSRVKEGGFAHQVITVMNEKSEEMQTMLRKSLNEKDDRDNAKMA